MELLISELRLSTLIGLWLIVNAQGENKVTEERLDKYKEYVNQISVLIVMPITRAPWYYKYLCSAFETWTKHEFERIDTAKKILNMYRSADNANT